MCEPNSGAVENPFKTAQNAVGRIATVAFENVFRRPNLLSQQQLCYVNLGVEAEGLWRMVGQNIGCKKARNWLGVEKEEVGGYF